MDGPLAREIIYLLFRLHQTATLSKRVTDAKTVQRLRDTKLSKELKQWLLDRQGVQTDAKFKADVAKLFNGEELKL